MRKRFSCHFYGIYSIACVTMSWLFAFHCARGPCQRAYLVNSRGTDESRLARTYRYYHALRARGEITLVSVSRRNFLNQLFTYSTRGARQTAHIRGRRPRYRPAQERGRSLAADWRVASSPPTVATSSNSSASSNSNRRTSNWK